MRFRTNMRGGFYDLNEFPGNGQLVVSNHAFIPENYRGLGHGDREHKLRLKQITELGYDCAMCTTVSTNIPQNSILENNGWTLCHSFRNRVTGNTNLVWVRNTEV